MSDIIADEQVHMRVLEYWQLLLHEVQDECGWSNPIASLQTLLLAAAIASGDVSSLDEARAVIWRNCVEPGSAQLRTRIAPPTPTHN
jgi:hypothetical protein